LHFASSAPLGVGSPVSLTANKDQVLVFPPEDK